MADLKPKKDEELELSDEEKRQEAEDGELFEEFHEENLSLREKILLFLAGFIGFIFFVIMLFPVEEIIRSQLTKKALENGISIDFKKLNFPLFGVKQVDSFYLLTKDNLEIKSEELNVDVSLSQLYKENLHGNAEAISFNLDTGDVILNLRRFTIDLAINNLDKGLAGSSGSINIQSNTGKIAKLPNFPFLGDLSGTNIKSIQLNLKKIGARINFEKAIFDLSIAKITVKGKLDYSGTLATSPIDIEICPKLTSKFATEREDLANTLELIGKNGEACIPVKGTIAQPSVNIPNLTGNNPSSTGSSESEKTENGAP